MVTLGAVKEREFILVEQGEYVLTLSEMDESQGNWGSRLVWKFLVAPPIDPTAYICDKNGEERTVWAFTDQDIILGSIQHEFIEKLTGKTYTKDTPPPDEDDLLGRRVLGYITHHTPKQGKNAGKKQELIVAGSIKAFKGPQPNKVQYAKNVTRPAESEADTIHAEYVAKVEKLIGRAVKFETPNHAAYVALNLAEADLDQLQQLTVTIQDEVDAALDS